MSTASSCGFVPIVAVGMGFMVSLGSPALSAIMCSNSKPNCEYDADEKLAACRHHCVRYDTACADFCADTHHTAIGYCWITKTVCSEIERPKPFSQPIRPEGLR